MSLQTDGRKTLTTGDRPAAAPAKSETATSSQLGAEVLDIWCITDMVLCNFKCPYCVAYPAVRQDKVWGQDNSYERFLAVTERLSRVPYKLRVRLQTVAEPFVSREFLERTAWLTKSENIEFIELVTNGSLLKKRLKILDEQGDLSKISLWITFHHTEISLEKFLDQVEYAHNTAAFVVVNALAFPDSMPLIEELYAKCKEKGIRVNVDPGYTGGDDEKYTKGPLIPLFEVPGGRKRLYEMAANKNVLDVNLRAAVSADGEMCSAGGDYFIILPDGRVGPCCPLIKQGHELGNVLDDGFQLAPGKKKYMRCNVDKRMPVLSRVPFLSRLPVVGRRIHTRKECKNKEDFGHLKVVRENEPRHPSFGWFGD